MKSRKARRITVAFDMVRLSSEKLRTKRPGRTGFHRLEYARILRTVALVLLAMLTSISAAWGQATTSLRGTVTDPSGKAVAGAGVVLSSAETKTARNVTTGDQGEYQFLLVPPGTYTLSVTAPGFRRYEQKDLALLVNTPATANVQLKIGSTNETVTVTSEAPAINMVDASLGNSFEEKQVIQLPLEGRNVPDLLSLQAGVAYTGNRIGDKDQDTRNGAVNGARSDQSNITLDGVDVNDQSNGYAFTSVLPVTQDSIEEFRVTTTNYGADQGQGSGAQVALVTKSGTNSLHGSAYEYIRNTVTSANDYLVKQSELNIGAANKPLQLNRNIFGASVGGPLRKDRLFFFTNYEGTREREQQRAERVIPTPSMCQGIFRYLDLNGNLVTVTRDQLTLLDPRGIGVDPAMQNPNGTGYLNKTFCTGQTVTNDFAAGDGFNYAGFVLVSTMPALFSGRLPAWITTFLSLAWITGSPPTAGTCCSGAAPCRICAIRELLSSRAMLPSKLPPTTAKGLPWATPLCLARLLPILFYGDSPGRALVSSAIPPTTRHGTHFWAWIRASPIATISR